MHTFQLGQGIIPNPNQELDLNHQLATDAPPATATAPPVM
jgi:hypothetical protein